MPKWMTFLHNKMTNGSTDNNIRLFLAKLIINAQEVCCCCNYSKLNTFQYFGIPPFVSLTTSLWWFYFNYFAFIWKCRYSDPMQNSGLLQLSSWLCLARLAVQESTPWLWILWSPFSLGILWPFPRYIISWFPWNLSFLYIHCTGQFTPKMKANAKPQFVFIFGVNWIWYCGVTASFGVFFSWNKM